MSKINRTDIQIIAQNNMPYKTGFMNMHAIATMETEMKIIVQYQTDVVTYIVPQEEGFVHHLSGQFIDKNQYFIRHKTMGAWNTYLAQHNAGEKPDMDKETEKSKRRASTRLVGAGVIERVGN